ncbi:MAG: hypothetical protein Q7T55_21670, partial [Solirubrobacteraceae bacterium]|nr:hypothetical protein [Solirubrobacteraceae bacterium]
MKLKTQILALGFAGTLLAGLAGGIGLVSTGMLGSAVDDSILAGQAQQASQEADMMHDAVRGDAQLALLGAFEKNAERIAEARKGLDEHSKTFDKALDQLATYPQSEASRAALAAVRPLVRKYVEAAERVIKASDGDAQAALALVPPLQGAFSELEDRMASLSELLEAQGTELNTAAKTSVERSRFAIGTAMALATIVMVLA